MKDSISVIIPAYNEEHSLSDAIRVVMHVISKQVNDYEIIIINDGSTDTTGKIADKLASRNKRIYVIHHKHNLGFGATFRDGIRASKKFYITGFPGDNDLFKESFEDIIGGRQKDGIVITYATDMYKRELFRRVLSYWYTVIMNVIFGLRLKYYNGYFIAPSKYIKSLKLISDGFTLFAEIKIKLIKKGVRYREIPYECALRKWGVSKAVTAKSAYQATTALLKIIRDVWL